MKRCESLNSKTISMPMVKLDHNRQAISDNFLTKVEVRDKRLQSVVFKKIPNVNQTLGFPEDKYVALGAPSRNNTGNVKI